MKGFKISWAAVASRPGLPPAPCITKLPSPALYNCPISPLPQICCTVLCYVCSVFVTLVLCFSLVCLVFLLRLCCVCYICVVFMVHMYCVCVTFVSCLCYVCVVFVLRLCYVCVKFVLCLCYVCVVFVLHLCSAILCLCCVSSHTI